MKTSLKTSKKLKEWGCKIKASEHYSECERSNQDMPAKCEVPLYDLIYDICTMENRRYFFGGNAEEVCGKIFKEVMNNKQGEAEKILIDNLRKL